MNDVSRTDLNSNILSTLITQRLSKVERGFYWETQINLAYNSQRIEGCKLTEEQTRSLFETSTISGENISTDDVIETRNHFRLFDRMIETYNEPLSEEMILEYQHILTFGLDRELCAGWKTVPNAVGRIQTSSPENVEADIRHLIEVYEGMVRPRDLRDITAFHVYFETIHPFIDGNGRIGRILMYKECLRNGITPFIVLDETKDRYYQGLATFEKESKTLISYFKEMEDRYMERYKALVKLDETNQQKELPNYDYLEQMLIENKFERMIREKNKQKRK